MREFQPIRFLLMTALVCSAAIAVAGPGAGEPPGPGGHPGAEPPIAVEPPAVAVRGVTSRITVRATGHLPAATTRVELRDGSGSVVASGELPALGETTLDVPGGDGELRLEVHLPELYRQGQALVIDPIPGWLTLLPPLLAIVMALMFRQVLPALLGGIWIGAWIVHGDPLTGLLRAIDSYVVGSLADSDHVSIILFSMMLGGMVGIVSRSGGTVGLVDRLRPYATTARRGQLVTWLLGLLVFFDDYANTLLVGNTMRPVTDRLKISREKLAYIVDSTAAPVAAIGLISTWIGYEVSLIADALDAVGSDQDGYTVFLRSIPYNFYPILALVFGLMIASRTRDFGPMLKAEQRARAGKVLGDGAVPLADFDADGLRAVPGRPHRWFNAVIPVGMVLLVTFLSLWWTGRLSLAADASPLATTPLLQLGLEGLGGVFSAGDSFRALLWGSSLGCLTALTLALSQRILSLREGLDAWVQGIKSMTVAFMILVLAWAIADVCKDLNTSGFMVASLSGVLDPRALPALIFLLAAVTAFSTGTSWGTMGILIPLAVPTAFGVAAAAGLDPAAVQHVLLGSVASVLAGAIFGDHCSPISDTTVLSSMASACDHVDHVRTQLPYAMVVGGAALLLSYLPTALGLHPVLGLVLGAAGLAGWLQWFGRPADAD